MCSSDLGRHSLVDELQERLPEMSVESVNAAIRRHLAAASAYVAVVADPEGAAEFARAVGANAPSPISYATETKPEVLAEDREIAVYSLSVDPRAIRTVPADALFETAELPGAGT